jgi:hypothetical protein
MASASRVTLGGGDSQRAVSVYEEGLVTRPVASPFARLLLGGSWD